MRTRPSPGAAKGSAGEGEGGVALSEGPSTHKATLVPITAGQPTQCRVNVGIRTADTSRNHVSWNDPLLRPGNPRSQHRGWLPDLRQILLPAAQHRHWYVNGPPNPNPLAGCANADHDGLAGGASSSSNPYPDLKAQKAFEKGLIDKTAKQTGDIILYDNRIVLYKLESDVMLYVVGSLDENEILLYNTVLALRDSLHLLFKYAACLCPARERS